MDEIKRATMVQKKVLILGARGLLGSSLTPYLKGKSSYEVITHSQTDGADVISDLSIAKNVKTLFENIQPEVCINLLALTDVALCEEDPDLSYKINISPVKNIVKYLLSTQGSCQFIQISTDHVYDKRLSKESEIKIVNNYALSKLLADEYISLIDAVVLRTNFFGPSRSTKKSFSDWVIESLNSNKQINGFGDVYFSPLHIDTLVFEIERVLQKYIPGVYNLGSREGFSKFEFIKQLCLHKNKSIDLITEVEYKSARLSIPRPLGMNMDVSKYETTYQTVLPTLAEEIKKC